MSWVSYSYHQPVQEHGILTHVCLTLPQDSLQNASLLVVGSPKQPGPMGREQKTVAIHEMQLLSWWKATNDLRSTLSQSEWHNPHPPIAHVLPLSGGLEGVRYIAQRTISP